jgi:hypothetical protein
MSIWQRVRRALLGRYYMWMWNLWRDHRDCISNPFIGPCCECEHWMRKLRALGYPSARARLP